MKWRSFLPGGVEPAAEEQPSAGGGRSAAASAGRSGADRHQRQRRGRRLWRLGLDRRQPDVGAAAPRDRLGGRRLAQPARHQGVRLLHAVRPFQQEGRSCSQEDPSQTRNKKTQFN